MIDENKKIRSSDWDGRPRWLFPVNCKICNNKFFVPKKVILRGGGKYCSQECMGKAKRTCIIIECSWCKKSFNKKPSSFVNSKSGLYFCCKECKDNAQSLNGFKELHLSHYGAAEVPDYRRRAIRFLEHKCSLCGYNQDLQMLDVDHIDGNRKNGEMSNLQFLCKWCHAIKTKKIKWHPWDGNKGVVV